MDSPLLPRLVRALQRRLIIFVELIQPKIAMNVYKKLLGERFILVFFQQIVYYQEQEDSYLIVTILTLILPNLEKKYLLI